VDVESVNYIEKPLSAAELRDLLRRGGWRSEEVMRTKEAAYKQLVAGKRLSDEDLVKVMAAHPELLERPIVGREGKAVLARPVEKLSSLGIR
jgi:arsenate reductase